MSMTEDSTEPSFDVDDDSREEVSEGVASTVYRARTKANGEGERLVVAIKSSTANRRFSPEPHDIIKEIAILSRLSHINIIPILHSSLSKTTNRWEIVTHWVPYSLDDLLNVPSFTPNDLPSRIRHLVLPLSLSSAIAKKDDPEDKTPSSQSIFKILTKSIVYQTCQAISYLHGLIEPVAHRDIKPRNVLLTETGKVQLIDFGIAYERQLCAQKNNLWPEEENEMYSDVATGPYRAPELLFGPQSYNACATDLWSLGSFVAQFYTPVILTKRSLYGNDSDEEEDDGDLDNIEPVNGFIINPSIDTRSMLSYNAMWDRRTLFDATRGSIGLAWSIFKIFGTPSNENWPGFEELPDAKKIQFMHTDGVPLSSRLPNLPSSLTTTDNATESEEGNSNSGEPSLADDDPLDLIGRLLVYPPEKRMKMVDVIEHHWLVGSSSEPLILPQDYPASEDQNQQIQWQGEHLGYWLRIMLGKPGKCSV